MSNTRPRPPIPRIRRPGQSPARSQKAGSRRRWPTWVIVGVSIVGIVVAIVASSALVSQTRISIALAGFVLVIVAGTAMLFVQRVLDVGVARRSGSPLISRFYLFDLSAFSLLLLASVANGIVIALQVARQ